MTFGEQVRALRKKKKISQNVLAKLAGVSTRTIFGYEAGTTFPRTKNTLERLANALDVTGEELMDGVQSLEGFAFIRADHSMTTQVRVLTRQVVSLLNDEGFPDAEKDDIAQTIMNAYWDSKTKKREKNDMSAECGEGG